MERLLTAKDVAERYGVTEASGRNYIHRIPGHMEKPLRVPETLLRSWEAGRSVWDDKPEKKKRGRTKERFTWVPGVSKIPMKK